MKNIFLIPTNQPSRIYYNGTSYKDPNRTTAMDWYISSAGYKPHNIFITKEEKIEEGDWMYYKHFGEDIVTKYDTMSGQNTNVNEHKDYYKKIILTTDQDLIKDGVQSINDNFLRWFVNNPSCEEVKVEPDYDEVIGDYYKIIIPSEEPKQEYNNLNYGGGFTEEDIKRVSERKPNQENTANDILNYILTNDDGVGIVLGYNSREMIEQHFKNIGYDR